MKAIRVILLLSAGAAVLFAIHRYVESEKQQCVSEQGYYFKGRCIKEGRILW